jgi:Leucine-rich repeat (LRR) protein
MNPRWWRTAFVLCLTLSGSATLAAIPASERGVLVTIYDTTNGAAWQRNAGWKDAPGTECSWYGVTCDAGQTTVTGLDLSWNNVAGPIPASISSLPNLEVLDLTANPLTGTLPIQLTQLSKLRVLRVAEFYGSALGGTIPTAIANLTNLETLDLSGNAFTGTIPAGIATLPKLKQFQAWVNQLSGTIPAAFFTHPTLEYLDLSYNSFSGGLPSTISAPALLELYLQRCGLTGQVPSSLGNAPKLTRLALNENAFSGAIPVSLGQLDTLEYLTLYGNQFTGGMPTELGNLTNLTYLDVGNNPITGPIPASIGNLKKLTFLSTYTSTLSGPIPDSLFTLTELQTLYLSGNSYNGDSPTKLSGKLIDFTRLTKLKAVDVNGQDIHGPIPPQIALLTQIESLSLAYNPIGGSIPQELGQLSKLGGLDLRAAELSGPIPESFGQLASLHTIALGHNAITSLPASFSSLKALTGFSIEANLLSGPIPATIAQLPLLEYVVLSDNQFSGPIPPELLRLPKLSYIDLSSNLLSGTIPPLDGLVSATEIKFQQNQLTGAVPPEIAQLTKLTNLRLEGNRLSGPLPSFGANSPIRFLHLELNDFSGSIPDLGGLRAVEELYLYGNRLTGTIPPSVGSLTNLQIASFSYNGLAGRIPKEIANCANLRDAHLYLEYNGLFNDDPSIAPFLARTAPGFEQSQTVAPTGVTVSAARARSLVLSWTPIPFTSYNGGYTIFVSRSANGPFSAAVTTPDKVTSTFTLDGLEPSSDYFVRIATSTYSTPDNKNTVTSDPSPVVAARTTAGTPAPASVVVVGVGSGIYQDAGAAGGSDSFTLANVGDLATTVTLAQEGDFFTQSPASFTLEGGAVQTVGLTGVARPAGVYTGASIPSGTGVPSGLRIPVRLLATEPVTGTVNAVASTNRVDVAAEPAQTSLPATVSFTNTGNSTLTGIVVTEAPWIAPPQGIQTIAPGQTVKVDFTVDRTKRADASSLAGSAISSLSLVYPTGKAQSGRSTNDGGSSTGISLVTVVDTVKPPTNSTSFPALQPGEVPLFLPGVGHVVGGVGLFLSDLSVINAFGTGALGDVRIYYTPAVGYPNVNSVTSASAISPGQSFALADVVKNVFGAEQVGTIQVRSLGWSNLVLNSNIFNVTSPRGTFGSSIPSFRGDRSIEAGSSLFINGLKKDATTRTNVFIQETSGIGANADLVFYDVAGAALPAPASSAEVPPFQLARLLDAVPAGAVSVKITNRAGSGGRITAYATPVDQTSGDFWSLADWSRVYASLQYETKVIPVAGKVRGANNTFFRSDVSVTGTADAPSSLRVTFYYAGGLSKEKTSINVNPGETRVLEDVVGTLFPSLPDSVVGYLVLEPASGSVAVTSRTYATQDGVPGTYGTAVPTLPLSRTIRLGQSKTIAGLDVSSAKTTGAKTPATFRTNMFLVEASGAPAKVRVNVVYADRSQAAFGSRLITKTIDLAPNQIYQTNVTQLIAETNPNVDDLRNVQLEFRVVDGAGAVFAFTSSIDNGSADQILRVE